MQPEPEDDNMPDPNGPHAPNEAYIEMFKVGKRTSLISPEQQAQNDEHDRMLKEARETPVDED